MKKTAIVAATAAAICLTSPAYAVERGYTAYHHRHRPARAAHAFSRGVRYHHSPHRAHRASARPTRPYVPLSEVCSFGFWCGPGIFNSPRPVIAQVPAAPPISPKAKLAHGIDRGEFRKEIAEHPELVTKLAWMVNGEVGREAPLPAKIVQLETAFNRAHARGQTLAHVLLSVKESHADGYYAVDTYCAKAMPSPQEVEDFKNVVLEAVLRGSNLSDVGYGPMTGNASAGVAAHQFAHGTPGYQLQAGDAYFREGPFLHPFQEISISALSMLGLGGVPQDTVEAP